MTVVPPVVVEVSTIMPKSSARSLAFFFKNSSVMPAGGASPPVSDRIFLTALLRTVIDHPAQLVRETATHVKITVTPPCVTSPSLNPIRTNHNLKRRARLRPGPFGHFISPSTTTIRRHSFSSNSPETIRLRLDELADISFSPELGISPGDLFRTRPH